MKKKADPKLPNPVTGVAHLADDFLEHFTRKVLDNDILAPTLATIINMSFKSGSMPANFKHAAITPPLLKKHNLDPDSMNNYRPISNLSFVSKLLGRHAAVQLRQHLDNNVLDTFQSAHRQHHSTETTLVRIQATSQY